MNPKEMSLKCGHLKSLSCLKELLEIVASVSNDSEMSSFLSKATFESLEFKLFDEICYRLLKHLNQNVTSITWPVISKAHHISFIKKLFDAIESIKTKWHGVDIPNYQKSHFQDIRLENEKVLDFLINLSALAVNILTKHQPTVASDIVFKEKNEILKNDLQQKRLILECRQSQLASYKDKVKKMHSMLQLQKQRLIHAGIFNENDIINSEILEETQIDMENSLVRSLRQLEDIRSSATEN